MDNTPEQDRVTAEQGRVDAEAERVTAEEGRVHAESNQGTGRVEAEEVRVLAEEERIARSELFSSEIEKFQSDPAHYVSPGARKILRRFTYAWIIVALAAVIGVWALTEESDNRVADIEASRVEIAYEACLDTNERYNEATIFLKNLAIEQRIPLNEVLGNEESTPEQKAAAQAGIENINEGLKNFTTIINALVPFKDCIAFSIQRFGVPPNLTEQGGEK